jgi:glyoxylase-like metal-dependent hydrolase (beta-lactamase superfamily II)
VASPRIHHLNSGTLCPLGARLVNGNGALLGPARLVCHVLLVETADGLVLVDTGIGADDVRDAKRLGLPFNMLTRPRLELSEAAVSEVRALGFDPGDVRRILLTHLDVDHAGGLPDFPDAEVHVWAREHEVMSDPPGRERLRYSHGRYHWAHGVRWVKHQPGDEEWFGFESVRVLSGLDAEILMIPLPGHTLGHTGVAVRHGDGWLLHCGDAYFHRGEVATPPHCPPGLRVFESVVQADGKLRRQNSERLRELAARHPNEVELICSHDPVTFDRAQAQVTSHA